MDVKSTWIPTGHPMDHVSWLLGLFSKNRLLEVGLPQNRETLALRTLTTVDLSYFIMCEDPGWIEMHSNSIWLRGPVTYNFTLHLKVPWSHYMLFEVCRDGLCILSFGLPQFHGHGSWAKWPLAVTQFFFNWYDWAGVNQLVHWFVGGKGGLDIQQGTSVWVGSPKPYDCLDVERVFGRPNDVGLQNNIRQIGYSGNGWIDLIHFHSK